ncbi:hypothetical protein BX616_005340 [Lobosporangium transversale]|uniref:Uncharacterized protein n=1 Tax=Lobosporangium transversale TaxID=64571 RepID=A0A1Y2GQF6_9FUNG|nr:hypothetical protein BCR41DRAFT_354731 [Lobosporangium transversale]KAF9897567.1 hypothetical protein BX616_005340 [Lobosporangium transversale]ORZ14355.1 hypothetical protein BCR41DRAFT_354731 [Lobosporangium transversale]|eukprot:XP_021880833.1 hypothetical protein BCR41DRAFT_354731 [Lobosporangium transversale]
MSEIQFVPLPDNEWAPPRPTQAQRPVQQQQQQQQPLHPFRRRSSNDYSVDYGRHSLDRSRRPFYNSTTYTPHQNIIERETVLHQRTSYHRYPQPTVPHPRILGRIDFNSSKSFHFNKRPATDFEHPMGSTPRQERNPPGTGKAVGVWNAFNPNYTPEDWNNFSNIEQQKVAAALSADQKRGSGNGVEPNAGRAGSRAYYSEQRSRTAGPHIDRTSNVDSSDRSLSSLSSSSSSSSASSSSASSLSSLSSLSSTVEATKAGRVPMQGQEQEQTRKEAQTKAQTQILGSSHIQSPTSSSSSAASAPTTRLEPPSSSIPTSSSSVMMATPTTIANVKTSTVAFENNREQIMAKLIDIEHSVPEMASTVSSKTLPVFAVQMHEISPMPETKGTANLLDLDFSSTDTSVACESQSLPAGLADLEGIDFGAFTLSQDKDKKDSGVDMRFEGPRHDNDKVSDRISDQEKQQHRPDASVSLIELLGSGSSTKLEAHVQASKILDDLSSINDTSDGDYSSQDDDSDSGSDDDDTDSDTDHWVNLDDAKILIEWKTLDTLRAELVAENVSWDDLIDLR